MSPVITAATDIASPPEEVWRVLTDFAGYAQWHPALRFLDIPTEYSFTILHYEAPQRLAWEGGVPEVLMGRHSFVLEPRDGGTRYTESEEFTGTAAEQTVEPARSQLEKDYASYGRALKERLESKYARAGTVTVRLLRAGQDAVIEITDDGVGGADPAAGSGLRGLSDRVEALRGRLTVVSPVGGGTVVRAELPVRTVL